jgi:nucleoside-diphosphate-sugar epimerase
MSHRIVVAGSTGNLGKRIVKALQEYGATVIALVRTGAGDEKVDSLKALGATVEILDVTNVEKLAQICTGADCVVSAVAGLHDVIVDGQNILLNAAVRAGVPRFIPSDFSTDFTKLTPGENRNFDLRREFHKVLDTAPIASTAIFNGAFAEILTYNIPVLDFKKKTVGYWDDPNHRLDFTTMDDTAAYTAAAALDPTTPRSLRIASFQVTPNDLVKFASETFQTQWELVRMGTVEELRARNKAARAANPDGENELYSRWQQGQYMQSMFSTKHATLENDRYPDLKWTKLETLLKPRS